MQRHELKALPDYVREGNYVFVHSMDSMAKNLDDLRGIVMQRNQRQVGVTL